MPPFHNCVGLVYLGNRAALFARSLFIPGIFFGGGTNPPQKKLAIFPPQTAAELCALNHFIGLDNELQIHHGKFSLMNNKHRKLFVIKQSKW